MLDAWTEAMLDGAFARAWAISDRVLQHRRGRSCSDLPYHLRWLWDGTPLAGRRVLVRCWHGLGDTLQFIRFVPRIAAMARGLAVEAQPALLPLLRASFGAAAAFYPLGGAVPQAEVMIESMEVPHALRLELGELPGPIPYLAAPAPSAPVASADRRPRVGLAWAAGEWRPQRSLPPALLLPLTRLPLAWIGLQLGPGRHDPAARPLREAFAGTIGEAVTIAETAAVVADLDLVVTVDTMVAHLAGALGRPVWVLLDAEADWRWMRDRDDSPWYPTMRLFRQRQAGAWEPVVEQVAAALTPCAPPGTAAIAAPLP